ncbi:MAG: ABC transporter ATP-binding protein [Acidobacteriota bacterium]
MLELETLNKSFGGLHAVRDVSFEAVAGGVTSIIGPNGAGKSTLFNLISGAIQPDWGRVRLGGKDITGLPTNRIARMGLARSFQITNLFARLSVRENVRLALQARETRSGYLVSLGRLGALDARADALLEEFGLRAYSAEPARTLSHGDQRRLEIAVCMGSDPRVLLLDEPTQGMSPGETAATDELVKRLAGRVTIVLIEHDIDLVMGISDKIVVLHQGAKLAEGTPAEVRADRAVQDAYLGEQNEPA